MVQNHKYHDRYMTHSHYCGFNNHIDNRILSHNSIYRLESNVFPSDKRFNILLEEIELLRV